MQRHRANHLERILTVVGARAFLAVAALAFPASAATTDLTLDRAIEMAIASHRTIEAAGLSVQGEALSVATAQSAFDLKVAPTGTIGRIGSNALTTAEGINSSVGVQVSKRFETGTVLSLGPSYNRSGADRNTTLSLSLEQPLVRGWNSAISLDPVKRAQFSHASSRRAFEQARVNVALEAIAAYYGVLREQRLVEFASEQRKRMEQHTAVAGAKERSGLIDSMGLLRARVRMKDAEDALNLARVNLEGAMNRLRRALELPLDADLRLAPPTDARFDGVDPESEATARRAEIVQLRAELDEALRSADVARRNVLPEVTLHLSVGQASQVDPFLVQYVPTTQRQWSVFLQSASDLARTAEKNAARQAALRVETVRFALESKTADVRREVREQQLRLADARVRMGLREEQIHQAETRLALAEAKFSHDLASNLDVLEAENELQRAEVSLAAARADYAVGVFQLRAMAGRLLPPSGPQS